MSTITPFQSLSTQVSASTKKQQAQLPKSQASQNPGIVKSTDTVHFSSKAPLFAGRSRRLYDTEDSHGTLVKGEASQVPPLEAEVQNRNQLINRINSAAKTGETTGQELGIMGAGFTSVFPSAAVGFADFGLLTLVTLLPAAAFGVDVGGKVMSGVSKKFAEFRSGKEKDHIAVLNEKQKELTPLKARVEEAESILPHLLNMKPKAKTAVQVEGVFNNDECVALNKAESTDYMEVDDAYQAVYPLVIKVPGFGSLFEKIVGRPLGGDGVEEVLNDLRSQDEETQALALKRLYGLEGSTKKNSKAIYPEFLESVSPKVAATALQMMNQNPSLRGSNAKYTQVLERFLDSRDSAKIRAALEGVKDSKLKSNTINLLLERISHPTAPYPVELKHLALQVAENRYTQGVNRELNPREVTTRVLEGLVGNDSNTKLKRGLVNAINQYEGALRVVGNPYPALTLYLEGAGGIGKTTLLQRLQNELHDDPDGLKIIKMGELRTKDDLLDRLREAQPLQGKTIFLDEFQNLDNPELEKGRPGIIQVLKDLFASENETGTDEHSMKAYHGIDVKDTILAVATNVPVDQMKSLRDAGVGRSVTSRITGAAQWLDLQPDLHNHLDKLVEGFGPYKFYGKAESRQFDGPLHLTQKAKEAMIQDLREFSGRTTDHSGRFYVNKLVMQINAAINAMERTAYRSAAKDAKGRIVTPLTIDVDKEGYLVANLTK